MITCCNLLCGCIAVWLATRGAFAQAFLFVLAGALFDFFDGFAARRLGVSGPLGIQMDSLADDITFGLAPSMMLFCYLRPMIGHWSLIALLMAAFSALRLGKFNIDERQHTSFIGLPTPANALFWGGITSMPAIDNEWLPWVLLAVSLINCYLLVSEMPMIAFKFKNFKWSDNAYRYIFLSGCVVILIFCGVRACQYEQPALFLFSGTGCVIWYVLYNIVLRFAADKK